MASLNEIGYIEFIIEIITLIRWNKCVHIKLQYTCHTFNYLYLFNRSSLLFIYYYCLTLFCLFLSFQSYGRNQTRSIQAAKKLPSNKKYYFLHVFVRVENGLNYFVHENSPFVHKKSLICTRFLYILIDKHTFFCPIVHFLPNCTSLLLRKTHLIFPYTNRV